MSVCGRRWARWVGICGCAIRGQACGRAGSSVRPAQRFILGESLGSGTLSEQRARCVRHGLEESCEGAICPFEAVREFQKPLQAGEAVSAASESKPARMMVSRAPAQSGRKASTRTEFKLFRVFVLFRP